LTPAGVIRDIADLPRVFLKYGPIPRFCIGLAGNKSREISHERKIDAALRALGTQTTPWLPDMDIGTVDGVSHRLFGIQTSKLHVEEYPFPLTPYISGLIIQKAQAIDIRKAKDIFDAVLGLPVTRTSAGYTFERLVLWRLRCGASINIDPMKGSNSQPSALLTVDKVPSRKDPLHYYFGPPEQMKKLIEDHEGQLVVPLKSNYASIDALLRRGKTIWLIQITLSESHPIKVAGLDEVLKGIPDDCLPSDTNKAKLVVITLSEGQDRSFGSANLVTAKKDRDKGDKDIKKWEARLEKYVAAVPKAWLFERV
jgi:hypothetical protein